VRTYTPKVNELTRDWLVIDAEGLVLGRLATVAASLLRGKHRVFFAPHVDTGDFVIIVNADKVVVTPTRPPELSPPSLGLPRWSSLGLLADLDRHRPGEAGLRSRQGNDP